MKKYIAIFLLVIMAISLVACTKNNNPSNDENIVEEDPKDEINEGENKIEDEIEGETENEIVDPDPKTEEKEVTLYFVNRKYVETGDESLDKLVAEKRTIQYGDISLEEAIVKELMEGPESEELATLIPGTVKLLGVELADGTAFVNFAREGLYGGSMQEDFTISQIVYTLTELNNVERVQFLVDGEKVETLMGHFEATEPFER
ncbi:MAG: GerMN domain-containing protein [Tissierellia bacterium]|nr:GerMN domain-containing protein [Tissierellia bacterium]